MSRMRWRSAWARRGGEHRARLELKILTQRLVVELVVALEGDAVDDRVFLHPHHQHRAVTGDRHVGEQAGRIQRLQAAVDRVRVVGIARRHQHVRPDRARFDTLVADHTDIRDDPAHLAARTRAARTRAAQTGARRGPAIGRRRSGGTQARSPPATPATQREHESKADLPPQSRRARTRLARQTRRTIAVLDRGGKEARSPGPVCGMERLAGRHRQPLRRPRPADQRQQGLQRRPMILAGQRQPQRQGQALAGCGRCAVSAPRSRRPRPARPRARAARCRAQAQQVGLAFDDRRHDRAGNHVPVAARLRGQVEAAPHGVPERLGGAGRQAVGDGGERQPRQAPGG